jgi:hypothetical protein
MKRLHLYVMPYLILLLLLLGCADAAHPVIATTNVSEPEIAKTLVPSPFRTVHVYVALCDNKYQGIVPVPAFLGNGQDPKSNLYWGAAAGVKTFFRRKQSEWELVTAKANPSEMVLERLLFRHKTKPVYMLADAYDGQYIRQTTIDFLKASSGARHEQVIHLKDTLVFGGASNLVSYIGHDGLMDFSLDETFGAVNDQKRDAIILACYSKSYFSSKLKVSGAAPLVWTTGLMAPEAYTLHDALGAWVNGKGAPEVRTAAAKAYAKYQKCSLKAAQNLLVTGW